MKSQAFLAILTPTYNRASTLPRLYSSLIKQSCKDFIWVIVDDGSIDGTEGLIQKYLQENLLDIIYLKKENGGKHTALNLGIKHITNELTFIVDSDDYLTNDAVQTIKEEWNTYRKRKDISGICFLRGVNEKKYIGDKFYAETICSYIEMRLKNKVKGDKAEIFRTELLKSKPFPEIKNEKFIGEDYVWCDLGKKYSMVWKNKIIYICEYLEGGLSKSGRTLRINCPVGGMLNSSMMLTKEFPLFFRIKKAILYNCYYLFADRDNRRIGCTDNAVLLRTVTFPIGWMLHLLWKKKYLRN